jgi:hypothetical protein
MKPGPAPLVLIALATAGVVMLTGCSGSSGPTRTAADAGAMPGAPTEAAASSPPVGPTSAPGARPTSGGPTSDRRAGGTPVPTDTYVAPTGAPYPTPDRDVGTRADQTSVLAALPGPTGRGCAVVGGRRDVRSGTMAAGNFQNARAAFANGSRRLYLYAIPQHARDLRSVRVMIDPRGAGATTTYTSTSIEQAEPWQYFALTLPIPAAGAYRLTMVAGANQGCFDVTMAK